MSSLFTTYSALQPPDIVSPIDVASFNNAIALDMPDNLSNTIQDNIDFNTLMNSEVETLNPIKLDSIELDSIKLDDPSTNPIKLQFNNTTVNNTSTDIKNKLINIAKSYIGTKYRWGGSNPSTGFDCSGLLKYCFKQIGIDLPRTAAQQGQIGQDVNLKDANVGDIIWFGSKQSPSGQHIGIISKKDENGQLYIIDAAGKNLGVTERLLPNLPIKKIKRIDFNNNNQYNFSSQVLNFFTNKGLTLNQSKGILGNLMQESNGDHTAVNKRSGAYGIAQWLGSRKTKLINKYGRNPSLQQQLEFIWHELNTTEKSTLNNLKQTNTIEDATKIFAHKYERAGANEMNMKRRIKFAYQS